MTVEEMVASLEEARRLVKQVHAATDLPQIQACIRHADQNLHWALWNLGEVVPIRPELED